MREVEKTELIRAAKPRDLYEIVSDYENYPRFFPEFTGTKVISRQGAVARVEFRAKMVKEVKYTLEITHHDQGPELGTSWTFVEGEIVSDSRGSWRFTDEAGGTRINYRAAIDVKAPLPGFILNRITEAVLDQSIPNMFKALEKEAAARRK
jgi:ribosome-associated toxin RatA of RatAB toxin-antitoxin module